MLHRAERDFNINLGGMNNAEANLSKRIFRCRCCKRPSKHPSTLAACFTVETGLLSGSAFVAARDKAPQDASASNVLTNKTRVILSGAKRAEGLRGRVAKSKDLQFYGRRRRRHGTLVKSRRAYKGCPLICTLSRGDALPGPKTHRILEIFRLHSAPRKNLPRAPFRSR